MLYGNEDPLHALAHDPDETKGRTDTKGGVTPFVLLIVVLGLMIGAIYMFTSGHSDIASDRSGAPDPASATTPATGSGPLPGASNPGKSGDPR